MEKQKVFWVVLAVSVFVVVVLIVGVLLLREHPGSAPRATVTPMNDGGTQVFEYSKPSPPAGGTGPQTPGGSAPAAAPPSGDQQTMHFYIGEGQPPAAPGTATPPAGQTPGTNAAPPAAPVPAAPSTAAPAVAPVPAAAAPATAAKPRTSRPAAAIRTAKKSAEYWIQAGAYKSQSKAEELVTMLEGKGLSSRVFSYTSGTDTFYRVRVGPYTNRGEADKFLGFVKQVQGLEASFISMIPAPRSAVN